MSKVYVLIHGEGDYDGWYTIIRGLSTDKAQLEQAQTQVESNEPIPDRRYKSGFREPTYIHNTSCCDIEEYTLGVIDAD